MLNSRRMKGFSTVVTSMKVGIVGVQGDVQEHRIAVLGAGEMAGIDVDVNIVRKEGVVPDCDALVLPGGESTTISGLIEKEGIEREIVEHVASGKPVLATCAGLIVMSRNVSGDRVEGLGVLDIEVKRNAFGRQKESFEAGVDVEGLEEPFHAVFIRAPVVTDVGEGVSVLAELDGKVVGVHQNGVVGTSFHPELTNDYRLHRLVLEEVAH